MNTTQQRADRRFRLRQGAVFLAISLLAFGLVACQGGSPSESTSATDSSARTTQDADQSDAEAGSGQKNADQSDPSDYLSIAPSRLEGRWLVMGQASKDAPRIVYTFHEDGTLTVRRNGEPSQKGRYEAANGPGVRLHMRDLDTGQSGVLTLRLATRRGNNQLAFDVHQDGERLYTLWLARLQPKDDGP